MIGFLHPEADFAWAVGLFEGEGTIMCAKANGQPHSRLRAQVVMTDRDVLDRFQAIVGFGNVTGPYNYKNSVKPLHQWASGRSAEVAAFARRALPYLSERRSVQVLTALDQFNTRPTSRKFTTPRELI